jgi:polyhydroxybutyrate depolymerase
MEIHGTADATVNYNGDVTFAPIDSVVKKWMLHDNCTPAPITYSVPNINTTDNSYAVNYKYTGGTSGSNVELYKVFGGSHSWPGAVAVFANTNEDFSASIEIWRFFRQYKLNQFLPGVGINEHSLKNNIKIFPNPVTDKLFIDGLSGVKINVTDVIGKIVIDQTQETSIDVRNLNSGIYFLHITSGNERSVVKFIKS